MGKLNKRGEIGIFIFVFLFIIIPPYFKVAGVQVRFLLSVLGYLSFVCTNSSLITRLRIRNIKAALFPMLLWAIVVAAVSCIHGDFYSSIRFSIIWLFIGTALYIKIDTRDKFLGIIDVVILTGLIVAILGIVEEITKWNLFSVFNNSVDVISFSDRYRFGIVRIMGFTSHPITYCVYCMFILGLIIYRKSIPKITKKKNNYLSLVYVLVIINSVLTVSRSVLLGIFISQLLLLWFSGKKTFVIKLFKIILAIGLICVIFSLLSEQFRNFLNIVYITLMALFSDNYASMLVQYNFGSSNLNGKGQRLQLYSWVWECTKDHLLIGNGPTSHIAYDFINPNGYHQIKTSIEVEYLKTLFRYGIIAAVAQVFFHYKLVMISIKKKIQKSASWEGKLSFGACCFSLFFTYAIVMLAVMQNEEQYVFFVLVQLFFAYLRYNRFENE